MKIKNLRELATTAERRSVLEIGEGALSAIDTISVLQKNTKIEQNKLHIAEKSFDLHDKGKIIIICIGKCAALSGIAFEKIFGKQIDRGVALGVGPFSSSINEEDEETKKETLKIIKYYSGTHPLPSEANVIGTKAILDTLQGVKEEDTVIFLVSGGGSTLLSQPPCMIEPESNDKAAQFLAKEREMLQALFREGATIQEINTLRKHMSLARGGFLAKAAYPAQVISIIFSDVPGNELGFISSGPTIKDETTIDIALEIAHKYHLNIERTCLIETPKEDIYWQKMNNILLISNIVALENMRKIAEEKGYEVIVRNDRITGEARDVGIQIAEEINQSKPGTVLLYCGETTVTIKAKGRGGRNQELILGALPNIENKRIIISLASDGHDNGPYAGALGDREIMSKAEALKLNIQDFLNNNDSSSFFEIVGGLLKTGQTGSNISDIMIALHSK